MAVPFFGFFRLFRQSRANWTGVIAAIACSLIAIALMANCGADDWPMWRQNSGRTGTTEEGLSEKLALKWVRHLPEIQPAFHSSRLQFDAGYEPIVADGRLLIASSRNDSVTAYESSTGRELWLFHTNGPVRFAPAVWKQSVCFGSDDGYLYCVELETGKLLWKHPAVPNERRLLGNKRLISVWPVRGGVVVADGIPSGGLLNVPYFYEGCTCSYPLPTALSLVAMPETHEQWSSWGDDPIETGSIERIGINFGAPGDRTTRDGTLWLDYPSVGGPSPKIRIETIPENPTYRYRHSNWMKGGTGWPWVAASSVEGLKMLTLQDVKPGKYTVRFYFAENAELRPGDRVQNIFINGQMVLNDFDILAEAKEPMLGIVRQFDGVMINDTFTIRLQSIVGKSLISGFELIRAE